MLPYSKPLFYSFILTKHRDNRDERLIIGTILLRIMAVLLLTRLLHGEVCSYLTFTDMQNSKLRMRLLDQMVWELGMLTEEVLLYSCYI
jgi:hypothetical protein